MNLSEEQFKAIQERCNANMKRRPQDSAWPQIVAPAPTPKRRAISLRGLNKTETRYRDLLRARGETTILEQAITLALDPPFRSYRADLVTVDLEGEGILHFYEVKGNHRFKRAGIAKVALASKTYPFFTFFLAEWTKEGWKETVLGGIEPRKELEVR